MQKIDAFICLFTNKREALQLGGEEKAPGPHPVWTCHTQGHEKTVLLMDAESGLWGCLSLSPSFCVSEEGKEGKKKESGVKEQGTTG